MSQPFDLDAYFERIEWGGAARPDYDTLAGLLDAHMAHIPFENLEVLLGRPVRLDLQSLQNKLVQARRGGYCFEQTTLFAAVLEQLGFTPVRHTARVIMVSPRHESPRTHMFLTVPLPEGTFIIDPGFGSLAPRRPVALAEGVPVQVGHEVHWMERAQREWVLKARIGDKLMDCWVSPLEPDNLIDFEVGNHYTSTHPTSPFVNRITMRALTPTGRVSVMNRDVTIREADASTTSQLADRTALRSLLAKYFGFDLPEVERLRVPSIPEWS
jgi:N-hydroxyarylamine O-acetyltransferase